MILIPYLSIVSTNRPIFFKMRHKTLFTKLLSNFRIALSTSYNRSYLNRSMRKCSTIICSLSTLNIIRTFLFASVETCDLASL